MSITTTASVRLRPARSCRADWFGTQPSLSIAVITRSRVGARTRSGELITFETVPSETPASMATSFMLTEVLRRLGRWLGAIGDRPSIGSGLIGRTMSEHHERMFRESGCPSPLDRAGRHALHDLAVEEDEHDQWRDGHQQDGGEQQVVLGGELALEVEQGDLD